MAITDTSTMKHLSGYATGIAFPGIADSTQLTGHTYRVTFDSNNKALTYSLKDVNENKIKIEKGPLNAITGSGVLVDGLRLWFKNDIPGIDSMRSNFISPLDSVAVTVKRAFIGAPYHAPIDIRVQFGSMDTSAAGQYLFPLDSAGTTNPNNKNVKTPFKVSIVNDTSSLQILIRDNSLTGKLNRWDFGEEVAVLTPQKYRLVPNNSHIGIIFNSRYAVSPTIPIGSQFIARTTKPFTDFDVYEFTADSKYALPTGIAFDPSVPKQFALEQNYPNPFNPNTTIRFSIPSESMTSLIIYDIMGREVVKLVQETLPTGGYRFDWNGKNEDSQNAASGIYFYRLKSGPNVITKKMIFMK